MKYSKAIIFLAITCTIPTLEAATIVAGNVTDSLGPNFFFDSASTGGGDTSASSTYGFSRDFGTLNVGTHGTQITITGFGFASAGNHNTASEVSMTITYLGANGAVGGDDDVVIGTVTDSITGSSTGTEYVWAFTTPLVATIDGLNSLFRFDITTNGTGNLRFKTTSTTNTGINAAKFSVAGTSVAVIPEPSTALAGVLLGLGLLRRRTERGL